MTQRWDVVNVEVGPHWVEADVIAEGLGPASVVPVGSHGTKGVTRVVLLHNPTAQRDAFMVRSADLGLTYCYEDEPNARRAFEARLVAPITLPGWSGFLKSEFVREKAA